MTVRRSSGRFLIRLIAIHTLITLGFGVSGVVLDIGLGAGFHTSDQIPRVFIDTATLGALFGLPSSFALAPLFGHMWGEK